MRELTIAIGQTVSTPGDIAGNLQRLRQLAQRCADEGIELLCLPEAFLTGYDCEAATRIALDAESSALAEAESIARTTGVALSFGYIERTQLGDPPYVTHVVTDGANRLLYRKTHLGPHEQGHFRAGDCLPVETIAGIHIGVHLCWEAHFPQIAATLRNRGAELLLTPFASGIGGEKRRESWMRFLPARANDNGCYLAACNALRPPRPEEDRTNASLNRLRGGGSMVFNPHGTVLAERFDAEEDLLPCKLTDALPRETHEDRMESISYFDYRRPELYM